MANYFTHFSCLLDVGTPENAARALDLYNTLSAEGASEEPPSEGFLLSIEPQYGGTELWMRDMRAFRSDVREYCAYANWTANGARARFFGHVDTCGDDVIRRARTLVASETADGLWN
ncbi:hypothetical protein NI456_03415 [Brevundimonas diminuta]|uniref:hypothetical protein n=1 Tax=Brevundimonas diminuta TaxID=293 RepID=UPI002097B46F|nr:hypothetical protein [Brevundimonas diminuta]MCO8017901.1 hypothetical protein [Brevundimonas diminuta]MCO8021421.1 hypothetical protein [Brevundimonas diminuta]